MNGTDRPLRVPIGGPLTLWAGPAPCGAARSLLPTRAQRPPGAPEGGPVIRRWLRVCSVGSGILVQCLVPLVLFWLACHAQASSTRSLGRSLSVRPYGVNVSAIVR